MEQPELVMIFVTVPGVPLPYVGPAPQGVVLSEGAF